MIHKDIFQWLINVNWFTKIFCNSNPNFTALVTWEVVFHKIWDFFFFNGFEWLTWILSPKYQSNLYMNVYNCNKENFKK